MPESGNAIQSPGLPARLRSRFGRSGLLVLALVTVIGAAALFHVVDGENPWGREVAKRTSQNLPLRVKEYVIIGLWWGCAAAAAISTVLVLGARLWLPGGRIVQRRARHNPPAPGGFAMIVLIVIMVAAAWYRVPMLSHSLWNDEEYGFRRHAHVEWERDASGRWSFTPVPWADTLFECRVGNNHHLNSVTTRLSLGVWQLVTGASREEFSETALRVPALVAGILTLALLVVIGCEMGFPWAGVGAAGLLAFHPWHVRYAIEARGYSMMLFFLCLALIGLIRAFRTNRVAAWSLFAIAEACCLMSFAGAVYPVAALNAFAALECLLRREPRRLGTLIGFNLLAAIPVIVWLLPSVPQVLIYMQRPDTNRLGMGWGWVRDTLCHVLSGAHYALPEMGSHLGTSWGQQVTSHPAFLPVIGWLIPALGIVGLLAAMFRGTAARLAVLSIALGGVLAFAHNSAKNSPMVAWHLIYLLIPLALAVALGALTILPWRERTQGPAMLLLLALFGLSTQDIRARLIQHDRQPMRQTVASIRDSHPEAMTAVFGVSDRQTQSYDPRVRVMEKEADLDAVLADAEKEGRPLFVYFCGRAESGRRNPDLMKRVLDPAAFKHIADFPGLEAVYSYHVYRAVKAAPSEKPVE